MRRLAAFCFAFAGGIFFAQYLLPQGDLALCAAAGFAALGALWALSLRGDRRRRALLVGLGLALALCWDRGYALLVRVPFAALYGSTETLTVELDDYPSAKDGGSRFEGRLPGSGLYGRVTCYGGAELLALEPGERVTGRFTVRSSAVVRGEETASFTPRGVYALLYLKDGAETAPGNAGSPLYLPQRFARRLQESIAACFPERTQPLLNAILLGDRFELDEGDAACLREAGLSHVTAVSGLHCGFLLSLVGFLVGRHRQRLLCAVALPVLALYAAAVGLTPSVLRACLMLAMLLLAPLFGRESDPPTALAFALFLILLHNPCAVKSVSLQLSFCAMAGLLWLTPKLYARIGARKRSRTARFALASLAATAGALVFTAPLTAFYFNSLALIAPLSNLLCLWAASLTFALGLPAALAGLASVPLGRVLAFPPHWGALYLLKTAGLLARVPYHAVGFTDDSLKYWLVYVYAMLAACLLWKRGRFRWAAMGGLAAATLALTLWLNAAPLRGGSLHVIALDVGQGQSVVLYSKGAAALVDCGSKSWVSAGGVTADYLRGAGVDTLDCVVVSHYHSDHCNGLPELLSRVRVKRMLLPDVEEGDELRASVLSLAARHGVPVTFVRETETVPLGDAALTVYPPAGEGDMNEECLAAVCTTGTFDALFTADMDANTEYLLAAAHPLPDVEVMLAGHHGSRWSTGGDLLAEVKPELCIVSCGADNGYGHPHREALRRMAKAGAAVCRTDLQGTIHITVN